MPSLRDRVKKGREQSSPSKNDKAAAFIGAADERAAASPLPWDAYDNCTLAKITHGKTFDKVHTPDEWPQRAVGCRRGVLAP